MRIVVTGSNGQLGTEVMDRMPDIAKEWVALHKARENPKK